MIKIPDEMLQGFMQLLRKGQLPETHLFYRQAVEAEAERKCKYEEDEARRISGVPVRKPKAKKKLPPMEHPEGEPVVGARIDEVSVEIRTDDQGREWIDETAPIKPEAIEQITGVYRCPVCEARRQANRLRMKLSRQGGRRGDARQ